MRFKDLTSWSKALQGCCWQSLRARGAARRTRARGALLASGAGGRSLLHAVNENIMRQSKTYGFQ
jgi:hypothetical protein